MSQQIPQMSLKQIVAAEYVKCSQDPVHFMKKYCMIQHPTRGKIPFHLYPFQEKTLTEFAKNRFNIVLKSRQTGISTLSAGFALWKMLFCTDYSVLVIATKQDVAKNIVTKVRYMHTFLPAWLKSACIEDNKLSLRFSNGSSIMAEASSPEAGRSNALSLLLLDEAAHIYDISDIWTSAQPALSTGGSCIALSTPNGVGGWFYKTWMGAEEETNPFVPIKLHWSVHPERDQKWRDDQDALLGPKMASQECDCSYVSSGDTVIDPEILLFYKESFVQPPVEKSGIDGNLWKWEFPDFSKSYMVCADVARGDGADYSTAHVMEIESATQVAEYKGKMDTKEFGNFLVGLATEYNDALLVVENANIGWATIQQIIDRSYKNLFYMSKDLKYVDTYTQFTNRYRAEDRGLVPGFSNTTKTRPLIISKLEDYFRDKSVTVRSQRLIDELFTFIWFNGKAEAMKGYNDDLTMAFAIGLWVRDTALRLRQEGIDLTKATVVGITSNSYSGVYGGSAEMDNNPWKMKVGDQIEDLSKWL